MNLVLNFSYAIPLQSILHRTITPNQDSAFAVSVLFTILNILLSSLFLTSPVRMPGRVDCR